MKDEQLYDIVDDTSDLSMVLESDSPIALADAPVAITTAGTMPPSTGESTLDAIDRRLDEIDRIREMLEEPVYNTPQDEDPLAATATISVVIPVRNMEATLTETVSRVMASPGHKEVILVDDMSIDCTPDILRQVESLPEITVLYKHRQEGRAAAIRDGIRLARGKVVITYDPTSGEEPPCFSSLARPIAAGECDVVYQSRFGDGNRKPTMCDRLITFLTQRSSGQRINDVRAGSKAFRRDLIKDLPISLKGETFDYEITAQAARRGERFQELATTNSSQEIKNRTGIADVVRAIYSYFTIS